jgi:hypothetical protein
MLVKEIKAVYTANYMKPVEILYEQNSKLMAHTGTTEQMV